MITKKAATEDAPDVDPVAALEEELRRLNAEHIKLRDIYQRLLNQRSDWERRVQSAVWRGAQDWIHHFGASRAAHAAWSKFGGEFGLARLIQQIPERPNTAQLTTLRDAAAQVRKGMRGFSDEVGAQFTLAHDELRRLRKFVREYGQKLHAESGRDPLGCDCAGCQLIIDMDVIGDCPGPTGTDNPEETRDGR